MEGLEMEHLKEDSLEWKDTEQKFQDAYDAEDKETMYLCMHRVSYATIKKRAGKLGLSLTEDEVLDKSLDATNKAYERMIRLNQRPRKLTGYLSWPVFEVFHGPKVRKLEKEQVSLDNLLEKGYEPYTESFEEDILDRLEKEGY